MTVSKRHLKIGLRTAISIGLLIYLFRAVGWQGIWDQMARLDLIYLLVYLGLGILGHYVSAAKWRVLSRALGSEVPLRRLFPLYLAGSFFNQFLPTSVGGDVIRAYELGRIQRNMVSSLASTFMERFTGITVLVLLAVVAILWQPRFLAHPVAFLAVAATLGGYVVGGWLVLSLTVTQWAERRFTTGIRARIIAKVRHVQIMLHRYRNHGVEMTWAMVLSGVFYVIAVLNTYVACLALGLNVSLVDLVAAVPVMLVIFMLPLSLGGIGLHEWAFTTILAMVGVPPAAGLTIGLIYRARSMIMGAGGCGAYVWLYGDTLFQQKRVAERASTPAP